MIHTDKEARANIREIRRLRARIANNQTGRNVGATESALDRRLEEDRRYYLSAAQTREV